MSKIYTSIDQLIGHTPLLELTHFEADEDLKARVLVKLEYFNPAGSVKDRVAKNMIDEAEKAGKLVRGGDYTIIEPTSGNTGVGIASVAAARGYKVIITMPETMSVERRKLMQAYGAQLVLTDGSKGMKGAIAKAEELHEQIPGSIIAGQFVNPVNPATSLATTGPEITGVTMHSVPGWVGDDHCITAEIEGVKAVVDICSSTSAIAGWSAVALLRNLASPVCFY